MKLVKLFANFNSNFIKSYVLIEHLMFDSTLIVNQYVDWDSHVYLFNYTFYSQLATFSYLQPSLLGTYNLSLMAV